MNKILRNIRFKIGYQFPWFAWSVVGYAVVIFLTFFSLIKFSIINTNDGSLVYRLWIFVIHQFIFAMRFKEDFDFLLTFSNTRRDIYLSLSGAAFFFSLFFSSMIVFERILVDCLNGVLNFSNISDPFHFLAPYATDNLFMQFVFFLMLGYSFSIFGLLLGSLFYRFGKIFTLFFWIIISTIPLLLLGILYQSGILSQSLAAIGESLKTFDLLESSGILLILAILFNLASFFNIRKLNQK